MAILGLGVSYRRASVELLERLAFVDDEYPKAYRRLADLDSVSEAVILSTCNRVEVFGEVSTYHAGFLALKRFLFESREVHPDDFAEPLYSHYEEDAAAHLFEVASGIDSMVLGEPQILAQVRQAYHRAEAEGATGRMLSALFRGAIRTGKRARSETAIGAAPDALVEAGTALAERALDGLTGKSALVVGAGGMASLAAGHLRDQGIGDLRIVNRSVERARKLAERAGAEPGGLEILTKAMAHADLVVSSTGSPGILIGPDAVREAMAADGRSASARPLFLLDLAVPRDVDPSVTDVPGVMVADIDDLKHLVTRRGGQATAEVEKVQAIVAEEVKRFMSWRRAARLAPLIQALRDRGARVQEAELIRLGPWLARLSERDRQDVEALAQRIVAKLLHDPIVRVKEASGSSGGDQLARALAELFGIEFRPGP
jgi:glutamyl-tRNA reductase